MVTVPFETPVIVPSLAILATFVFEELYLIVCEYPPLTVALSFNFFSPIPIVADDLFKVTFVGFPLLTFTVQVLVFPLLVLTLIFTVPFFLCSYNTFTTYSCYLFITCCKL